MSRYSSCHFSLVKVAPKAAELLSAVHTRHHGTVYSHSAAALAQEGRWGGHLCLSGVWAQ